MPGKFEWKFRYLIFQIISVTDVWGISCELVFRWMSLDLADDKSTLVQVMAWCRQATSHYLSQCWPRSLSPYGVTRPEWVKAVHVPKICWWLCRLFIVLCLHMTLIHWGFNKMVTICTQSFRFIILNFLVLWFKFTAVYSWWSNWQYISTISSNGLLPSPYLNPWL